MIYVRKVSKTDPEAEIAKEWLANDPEHQKLGIQPEDVFEDGTELALIYDEQGPIMAARFHRALRAAVQFNPQTRLRNARAGKEVAEWFQKIASESGCKEVIVRPGGRAKRFTERLGFSDFIGKVLKVF
jgi:hypothetical protein